MIKIVTLRLTLDLSFYVWALFSRLSLLKCAGYSFRYRRAIWKYRTRNWFILSICCNWSWSLVFAFSWLAQLAGYLLMLLWGPSYPCFMSHWLVCLFCSIVCSWTIWNSQYFWMLHLKWDHYCIYPPYSFCFHITCFIDTKTKKATWDIYWQSFRFWWQRKEPTRFPS